MNDRGPRDLRAVVIGAGFAGEGHVKALRHCGVEVAAICARQPEVVMDVADRLAIPEASTDWRDAMERLRPDIVTLATPASLRTEPVELACELGCHVMVEKAFATNEPQARRLLSLVEEAGVKHAFGVIHRYSPTIAYASDVVSGGAIGTLREVELTLRFQFFTPLLPWSYVDNLSTGGGMLGASLVHTFPQLERLAGGLIVRVTGEARKARERAPYDPSIHDFRQIFTKVPSAEEASRLEWRSCDADGACTALLGLASSMPGSPEVQAAIVASAMQPDRSSENGWRLYGDEGTLIVSEVFEPNLQVSLLSDQEAKPKSLDVPARYVEALPNVGDDLENKWIALFRDFLADIRGEPHGAYPTFRDGWRYQVVIDAIRAGSGWQEVPV